MKEIYILTANAEINITRPLLTNLPSSGPSCRCTYIQSIAAALRIWLTADTYFCQIRNSLKYLRRLRGDSSILRDG
jgi:hypothetical protein